MKKNHGTSTISWGIFKKGSQSWGAEPGLPGDGTLEDTWARLNGRENLWKTQENPRKTQGNLEIPWRFHQFFVSLDEQPDFEI